MTPDLLLDTNVLIRHLTGDHDDHSSRATAFLHTVARGELQVRLLDTVIFETVYTLMRRYELSREEVRFGIEWVIDLPAMILPGKQVYHDVFDLWVQRNNLSFADCYHLCMTRSLGIPAIMSFDKKMSRYPGVERIEP